MFGKYFTSNVKKVDLLVAEYIFIFGIFLVTFNSFEFLKFLLAKSIIVDLTPKPKLIN